MSLTRSVTPRSMPRSSSCSSSSSSCFVQLLLVALLSLACCVSAALATDCSAVPYLFESVPLQSTVNTSAPVTYFWYTVDDPSCTGTARCQLTIILTPIDNDVDLYALPMTAGSEERFTCPELDASNTDLLWSENVGGDALVIPGVEDGVHYLIIAALVSERNATYTLYAELSTKRLSTNSIQLENGLGMYGAVTGDTGDQDWYYFIHVDALTPQSLTVTLSVLYGQPVVTVSEAGATLGTTAGSVNSFVTVAASTTGDYNIRVHATEASAFFVTAAYSPATSSGGAIVAASQRLRAGVPFPGSLSGAAGEAVYFYLPYSGSTDSAIVFTLDVTSLGGGEADLYVSQTESLLGMQYPGKDSDKHFWAGELFGSDIVTIRPGDVDACKFSCNYTAAVVPWGVGNSSFTLTASTLNVINLVDAVQVRDQFLALSTHYYRYTPLVNVSAVTITVSPSVGIVSLFIATYNRSSNATYPDHQHSDSYNKSVLGVGELTVTVSLRDSWFCGHASQVNYSGLGTASCSYYISVYASNAPVGQLAQFTITASSTLNKSTSTVRSTQPVLLTNTLQSTLFTAANNTWSYYYLRLASNASLSLTLTSITGDVDLYYQYSTSDIALYPNESTAAASAESSTAVDVILIEPAAAGYYWLAVNAWQTATYRLSATIYDQSVLLDGVSLSAIVSQYRYKYYDFTVSNTTARLTISVFKKVGEPDLYVGSPAFVAQYGLPSTIRSSWKSVTYYTDIVTIDYPAAGTYVIAVYGFDTTLYQITASTREANRQLLEDVGQGGNITQGLADYFRITIDRTNIALTVIVTVLSGDCDLYLSAVETQPGPINNGSSNFNSTRKPIPDFMSATYGHDGITVPLTYLSVGQIWYAGVVAASSCTYSISYKAGSTERLQDGRAQGGTVTKSAYRYYVFTTTASQPYVLTIGATPTFGTVQLFVISSSTNTSRGLTGNGKMLMPSHDLNDLASKSYETSPVIVIQPGDVAYCSTQGAGNCTYWIAVWGTSSGSQGSNYTMVARTNHTNSGSVLQARVSTDGYLAAGQYEYYEFRQPHGVGAVLFTVTPRDVQSDPDMFISCRDNNTQPTAQTADYSSVTFGGDSVAITSNSTDCWVGKYYVAIFASSGRPARYSLLGQSWGVSLGWLDITHIVSNQEYTGLVIYTNPQLQWRYYRYYPSHDSTSTADITITLTAEYGDPDMYVTDHASQLPSQDNCTARSDGIAGGSIIIPAAEQCTACYFTIGVMGFTTSLYHLTVTTSPQTIQLTAGRPYPSRVDEGGIRLFVVNFVDHADLLTITVTSITGDADVYVSTHSNVSSVEGFYQWSSINWGTDVVSIPQAAPTAYYIAVHGFYAAEFTIVATLGATALAAGVPQHDYLGADAYRLYVFGYGEPAASPPLTFSVTSTNGLLRFVNLYVSNTTYPDSSNALWRNVYTGNQTNSANLYGSFNLIVIKDVTPNAKYWLRVEAVEETQYDVVAYYANATTVLSATRFTVDSVRVGQCKQYVAQVSAPPNGRALPDVSFDVIESVGDVVMYVGFRGAPNSSVYDLTSGHDPNSRTAHVGVDSSSLSSDLTVNNGQLLTLYVAVCGVTASTYSLSYTTNSIYLPINQPLSARSPASTSQPLYFFVQSQVVAANANLSVTILGTAVDGSQDAWGAQYDIYACNNKEKGCETITRPDRNNASTYRWSGSLTNGGSWTLPATSTLGVNGTYVFALYSSVSNASFVITVVQRTNNATRLLVDQERVNFERLEGSSGLISFYQTQVPAAGLSTAIEVTVCQGAAQVAFSETYAYPTKSNSLVSGIVSPDGSPFAVTPQRNGQFFFSVSPTDPSTALVYSVQVYTAQRPSARHFDFSNRTVSVRPTSDGGLEIGFLSANVTAAGQATGVMQYVVYWSDVASTVYQFETACGCHLAASNPSATSGALVIPTGSSMSTTPTRMSTTLTGLSADVTYKVNVVARLIQSSSFLLNPLSAASFDQAASPAYSGTFRNSGGVDSGTLAAIAIPVVACVVAAFAYLVYRNRQLTRELSGVEMTDVPRGQVLKAAAGGGFRARAAAKLNSAAAAGRKKGTRYSQLLGMGGVPGSEEGGRELSTNELGLDDDDVDVDMEDGEYDNAGGRETYGGSEDDQKTYTLDAVVDDMEREEHSR